MEMCVAMLGSIMPTPLATPTIRAGVPVCSEGPPTTASANFGLVSVVMMARATSVASVDSGNDATPEMPARILSIGYWRPITPVEAMTSS